MMPSAATFALQMPGGMAQAMGLRSLGQLAEPGPDPESSERYLLELLDSQT
jgi:hypothetical protein